MCKKSGLLLDFLLNSDITTEKKSLKYFILLFIVWCSSMLSAYNTLQLISVLCTNMVHSTYRLSVCSLIYKKKTFYLLLVYLLAVFGTLMLYLIAVLIKLRLVDICGIAVLF